MKRIAAFLTLLILLLGSCGQRMDTQQTLSDGAAQSAVSTEISFERTTFCYGGETYDVISRIPSVNSILSVIPVGEKLVVECHAGPQNGVYCIFDTVSKSFEADLIGNHLIWYDNDITTAVYSFGANLYACDGTAVGTLVLAEGEMIRALDFSDENTKVKATIIAVDGTERIEEIELL